LTHDPDKYAQYLKHEIRAFLGLTRHSVEPQAYQKWATTVHTPVAQHAKNVKEESAAAMRFNNTKLSVCCH